MVIISRNNLWYTIVPILQDWLIPSQIKQLKEFQSFWSILNTMEKCLLIKLMIDLPQNLYFVWQYTKHDNVCQIKVNNAFQYIQQVSFLIYVQKGLQQNDDITKYLFHLGIMNQIKRIFHFDMVDFSLKKIKMVIVWLVQITPFIFKKFIIDVIYRPIWISLDECHQRFPNIPQENLREKCNAIFNLKHKSSATARLYQLQYVLIRKYWNYLQDKINTVEQQIERHLNLLSNQLLQI